MDELFSFKLSTEDKVLLEALAAKEGESMATVLRISVRERGAKCGLWPLPASLKPVEESAMVAA